MKSVARNNQVFLLSFCVFFIIFLYDTITPRGYVEWPLYFVPFLLNFPLKRTQYYWLASAATVLIIAGLFLSPGELFSIAVYNRAFGIILLWVSALRLKYCRSAETQRQRFFDLSLDILGIASLKEGRWKSITPAITKTLGFSKQEFEETPFVDMIHPDDVGRTNDAIKQLLEGKNVVQFEQRMKYKEGGYRWISWSITPHPEEEVVYCVGRDVTENKRLTDELYKSEQFCREKAERLEERQQIFEAMMESLPMGIVIARSMNKIEALSRYGIEMSGMKPEETKDLMNTGVGGFRKYWRIFKSDGEILAHDEDLSLTRAIEKGERSGQEEWVIEREGKKIPVLATAAPIRDKEGKIIGGVLAWQDITERKQTEDALRQEQERLRTVLEILPVAVFLADVNGKIIMTNAAAEEIWGEPPRSERYDDYKEDYQAWWPETGKRVESSEWAMSRALTTGKRYVAEEMIIKPRNSEKLKRILNYAFPVKAGEKMIGGVAINIDITKQKEAEDVLRRDKETFERMVAERTHQLLEAQKKLDQAERLSDIGKFSSSVAHELRNPLAAINMAAVNIERKIKKGGCDVIPNIESIEKKIKESDQIINNLLFYSRLREPHWEKTGVNEIIMDSIEMAQARHPEYPVQFKMRLDGIKDRLIDADRFQLKEVFTNVINNAYDALENQTGMIALSGYCDDGFMTIRISDTGKGISPENLKKVFEAFFSTKAKGTGLGLSVGRQIIESHGGNIDVQSEPGKGTTVIITLPLSQK